MSVSHVTFLVSLRPRCHRYNDVNRPPQLQSKNNRMYREVKDRKGSNPHAGLPDRRRSERRAHVLRALLYGSFRPRRRGPRRENERGIDALDWHHPQWLAISMLIVIGSCTDALLTLILVERGVASEANPLMAPLLGHSALAFALVKVVLTAGGVVLLTQLARIRAFGRIPVGVFLYLVLAIYGVLITYEINLLNMPP